MSVEKSDENVDEIDSQKDKKKTTTFGQKLYNIDSIRNNSNV